MEVKYEIHTLKNVSGEGGERKFVALKQENALTEDEMAARIEESSSLTKADVRAVFTEFRHLALQELQAGRRVNIPGIGWLSLSAGLSAEAQQPEHKITGRDVYLRSVIFRTEEKFYTQLVEDVNFVKSGSTSKSASYAEDELWAKIEDYLSSHDFLTYRVMLETFGLRRYVAEKWMARFVGQGKLRQTGTRFHQLFVFADKQA